MKTLTVKIPESTENKLNSLCQQTLRTKSFLIREALGRYFDEDAVYRKALDRLNDSKDEIITSKKMSGRIA